MRQVAHRLGFTRSEVTSLEQVVGGRERASTMLLHLLLVWQKQKHRGKEAGREELVAALHEGGMPDAAVKVVRRRVCVFPCDADVCTHILSSHNILNNTHPLLLPQSLAVQKKVLQPSSAQLLSPDLEECKVDLASSHIRTT